MRVERDTMIDGRYRVVKRLGSGGMADVFWAHDTQLGREVAVKVLYSRFAEDAQFVERFQREASSAAGLSIRTSSASSTAASGTAPTTSRWS